MRYFIGILLPHGTESLFDTTMIDSPHDGRSPDEDISEAVVAIPAAWFREVQLNDLLRLLLATYGVGRQKLSQV